MYNFKKGSIRRESTLIVLYSILTACLNVAIFALAARMFEPVEVSSTILILTISWYLVNVFDFGMGTLALREVVSCREKIETFNYITFVKIVCASLATLVICLYQPSLMKEILPIYFLSTSLLLIQQVTTQLKVNGFTSSMGLIALLEKSMTLVILAICLLLDCRLKFIEIICLGVGCSAIFSLTFMSSRMKKIGWRRIRHLVKDSIGMGLSSIIGQAKLLDVNFLSAMIGSLASVPFVVVTRLTSSLGIFSNAFSQAISPTLAKNEITKEDKRDLRRSAIWLFFAIFSAALVFVNASTIVDIVLGDKYRSSVPIVKILAVTSIFSTLAQPLTVLVQNQANPLKVTFSLFSGFLMQVGFIYLFSQHLAALSAAIGLMIGQFVSLSMLLYFARRHVHWFR